MPKKKTGLRAIDKSRRRTATTIARELAAEACEPTLEQFDGVARNSLVRGYSELREAVKDELDLRQDDDSLVGLEAAYLLGVEVGKRIGGAR